MARAAGMALRGQKVGIQVEGARELSLRLAKASPDATELKAGYREVGEVVVKQAQVEVPVKSGRLQRSIKSMPTTSAAVVQAGTAGRVPYAGPIHFGWAKRHIKPQPFLYTAMDKRETEVLEAYSAQVHKMAQRLIEGS